MVEKGLFAPVCRGCHFPTMQLWDVLTRRGALLSTGLTVMLAHTGTAGAASEGTMPEAPNQGRVARSETRVRGFAGPEIDFQLRRGLGHANYMGAAVGEILAAGRGITHGAPRTWPPAFAALGE